MEEHEISLWWELTHDPVMIGIVLLLAALLATVTIALTIRHRRSQRGIALYKTQATFNHVLNQPVIVTNPVFSANTHRQDEILLQAFPPGKKVVTLEDQDYTVARVKKEMKAGMQARFAYSIYFAQFEGVELPATIAMAADKTYREIRINAHGIVLRSAGGEENALGYDSFQFSNGSDLILAPLQQDAARITLAPADFAPGHYLLLEELLIKYANFRQMHF